MKLNDIDSNSSVSAHVLLDNMLCSEHNVINTGRTAQCSIPFRIGQTTILGYDVRTLFTCYQVDLIVDGVVRVHRFVNNKSPLPKHELIKRSWFQEKTSVNLGNMEIPTLPPSESIV